MLNDIYGDGADSGEESGAENAGTPPGAAEDADIKESASEASQTEEPVAQEASHEEVKAPSEEASGEIASAGHEAHSVVGIRFEPCGKVYHFRANGLGLKLGERVVVESELGVSIGRVVIEDEAQKEHGLELKPVLRRVSEDDLKKEKENLSLKKEAFDYCNERIMARGLAMKLLGTDVTLDKKRIVFFFSAETRIDFRELVKDLAAKFRTRIELRQVGVRDAARITGGLGVCGRELCCRRFLTSFLPISIKMAKKQELALNTSKLSGICGRLMCCLGYEYEEKLRELKKKGKKPVEEEAPEHEEQVEETVVQEQEAAPVEVPQERPAPSAGQRPEGETPERKRRRRRRRRSGRRTEEGAKGQEQRPEPAERPQRAERPDARPSEGRKSEAQPSGEKPAEGTIPGKPFRKKRRRRMRGKKKE